MFYVCKHSAMRLATKKMKILWISISSSPVYCIQINVPDAIPCSFQMAHKTFIFLTKIFVFHDDEHLRSIGFIFVWSALTHWGFSSSTESNYITSQFSRSSYSTFFCFGMCKTAEKRERKNVKWLGKWKRFQQINSCRNVERATTTAIGTGKTAQRIQSTGEKIKFANILFSWDFCGMHSR